MKTRTAAARAVASVIIAGSLMIGTAGCSFITPIATLEQYDPSDGVNGSVGQVDLRNVLALISEDGSTVSLLVTLVNNNTTSANVNIQFQEDGKTTTLTKAINAKGVLSYGNTVEQKQILVTNPGVPAGSLFPVYFQYGDHEGTELLVPVLEGHFEEYAPLAPANAEG